MIAVTKYFLAIWFQLSLVTFIHAQDPGALTKNLANEPDDTLKCAHLYELSQSAIKQNPLTGIAYADQLEQLSLRLNHRLYLAKAYHLKGLNCYESYRFPEASKYYDKAKLIYEELSYQPGIKKVTEDIAKVLSKLSYFPKASEYTKRSDEYKTSLALKDSITQTGKQNEKVKQEMITDFTKKESQLKLKQQLTKEQLDQTNKELKVKQNELALSNKIKELQRMELLKESAEKKEREKQLQLVEKEKALQSTQLEILAKDKKIQEAAIETQKKTIELNTLQRNGVIVVLILLSITLFFIFRNFRNQIRSNRKLNITNTKLQVEKQKTEDLLHNILPIEVADELKLSGSAQARQFENVTVLFTDFVNFTLITETLTPKQLVSEIDNCFKAFDNIIQKHGLEKIKTIGDAYMAVCGLPHEDKKHATKAINAAREILEYMKQADSVFNNNPNFKAGIRIGVHSGPVVAGIVGLRKFAYDIWGDTVNTAARMEQNSEQGKINISQSTYDLVKEEFHFENRGKLQAKNKGVIEMYFIKGCS